MEQSLMIPETLVKTIFDSIVILTNHRGNAQSH